MGSRVSGLEGPPVTVLSNCSAGKCHLCPFPDGSWGSRPCCHAETSPFVALTEGVLVIFYSDSIACPLFLVIKIASVQFLRLSPVRRKTSIWVSSSSTLPTPAGHEGLEMEGGDHSSLTTLPPAPSQLGQRGGKSCAHGHTCARAHLCGLTCLAVSPARVFQLRCPGWEPREVRGQARPLWTHSG